MTVLVDDLVPDQLWALVEPLLPAPPRPPYGGRRRTISDRTWHEQSSHAAPRNQGHSKVSTRAGQLQDQQPGPVTIPTSVAYPLSSPDGPQSALADAAGRRAPPMT
jgi:hypothetical protein